MKIVVLDGYTENPGDLSWSGFEKLGDLKVYDRTPKDLIVERAKGAEAVFTNKTPLSRETLSQLLSLRFIGVLATGYNVVDVAAAKERGVPVSNIPAYGTAAVAQFSFALLLEICHHVGAHSRAVQNGGWTDSTDWCFWNYPLIELAGKKMGIIGLGRIGKAAAGIAQAFGMDVLAFSRHADASLEGEHLRYVGLDELIRTADVIDLHCPLFDSTRGMINRETIGKMKDGVIIINDSRGPLIVEQDLADALNSGKVAGAGLDVLSDEPPRADNPLLHAKNCFITPHIAWAPRESRQRLMDIAVNNLACFIQGSPVNVVNV